MVFSSIPLYLDPPNWQQHPNQQQQQIQGHHNTNNNNHHEQNQHNFISEQVLPQPHHMGIGPGGPGPQPIRTNSMSERARLARIPPPEAPLKCPRCESTNTKFCYYNNYSLSQPRHFCKTCRRYWTRGGALRNVPVGGGCRRNKRPTTSTSNKSSSSGGGGATSSKSSTMVAGDHLVLSDPGGINVNSMSFMASLQNIAQLGGLSNMGLTFGGGPMNNSHPNSTPLGVGAGAGAGGYNLEFHQQQQQQVQFPNFLGGFEIPAGSSEAGGLYSNSFQNVVDHQDDQDREQQEIMNVNNMSKSSSGRSMMSPVKMEDNGQQGVNLAKQLMMGISSSSDNNHNHNHNQFWGGNITNNTAVVTSMWTDLSGLNSSSTTRLL